MADKDNPENEKFWDASPRGIRGRMAAAALEPIDWKLTVDRITPDAWSRPQKTAPWVRKRRGKEFYTAWTAFHRRLKNKAKKLRPRIPFDGPIFCALLLRFRGPEWDWHCVVPDADNLAKGVGDMLQKAGVLRNDSRVCLLLTGKVYAPIEGLDMRLVRASREHMLDLTALVHGRTMRFLEAQREG